MDGPCWWSKPQDFWNENCFPQREMKNYSRKSTTSNNYAESAWVLESTHLNKQSIFKDRIKTTEQSTIISKPNLWLWYDFKVILGRVLQCEPFLKTTWVGCFGEIGVFLANKISWTLWNHHLLYYIYIHIISIILARFVPTIPGKQRLGFLWTIEFLVWNLSWNLRSTRRNKNPTCRWSNTPNGIKQRVH